MGILELEALNVGYGSRAIVRELHLEVAQGEMVALLGPSGGGKTSILKTIAGLLPPLSGTIRINGQMVNQVAAEKREVVLIFQKPLLFPFLDVGENIGFGLRMQGIHGARAAREIAEMAELTGLGGLERRKIQQLSGGQQQRVALARGLVLRPSLLLLDEPLSNLDPDLRQQMRELIQAVCRQTRTTTLFVSHDQSEALMLSDRVALLLGGSIRQLGTPRELFYRPADREVAAFFGCSNLLEGVIMDRHFSCAGLPLALPLPSTQPSAQVEGKRCIVAIRPEQIELAGGGADTLTARVESLSFEGALTRLEVRLGSCRLTVLSPHPGPSPGSDVQLAIPASAIHVLPCP
ncbi:ABC transporter ATP-binding protein [Desulfogranum mediterraneum]|uniref:ABC transporter ATP-binding protein n=1 Tax=Desulfogranum mediterraneum TaxID=160661 RepID=UPI00042755C6|nr:ABC transporter ATP-binding protein [Desulfogranum mediterraneum]